MEGSLIADENVFRKRSALFLLRSWGLSDERPEEAGEFHRKNKLRRRARAKILQRFEVLQAHRVPIERLGNFENLSECDGIAFGTKNRRLPVAFGLEDGGLLFSFRYRNFCCAIAFGSGDHGTAASLGAHLLSHRILNVPRRIDLTDFHRSDLAAPALGHFIKLAAQDTVNFLSLGQHIVQRDIANDGTQGSRSNAARCSAEILHLDYALDRVRHLPIYEKIDGDGRIVLRDTSLAR